MPLKVVIPFNDISKRKLKEIEIETSKKRGGCVSPHRFEFKLLFSCCSLDRMDVSNHINQSTASQSNSPASSNSELDKDLADLDLNGGNGSVEADGDGRDSGTNGDKTGDEENGMGSAASIGSSNSNPRTNTLKKRISSSRTPTRKAKRVRFFRNGDRFYAGIVIPVSNERYR